MVEKNLVVRENDNVIIRQEEVHANDKIFCEFNKAWVSGIIEDEFEYSHETFWEKFYKTRVKVTRLSGVEDYVPIMVSNFLLFNMVNESLKGKFVEVGGQFRSYNKHGEDGRSHLKVQLFATVINIYNDENDFEETTNANLIYLDGYICKEPIYRKTPLGREIADLIIAVNRNYNKSDYIPAIAWGRNAQYASKLEIGNRIRIYGRIQSRQYFKMDYPGAKTGVTKETYEVSIMRLAKVQELLLEV